MTSGMDLDDIQLAGLTAEELEELSEFIDPDNELLPASDRIPVHTKKKPTGPYDRTHLISHLKKEATESTVGDDYIPFTKKHTPKDHVKEKTVVKPVAVKTEFDDILDVLDEEDLAELASELGLHGLVNQAQSRGDDNPVASPQTALHKQTSSNAQTALHKQTSSNAHSHTQQVFEDIPQEVDIEEAIELLAADDESLTELTLNNHTRVDSDLIDELIRALAVNLTLERLQMANIKLSEDHAIALAEVLKTNSTLVVLNLESNRVTRKGIKALMKALSENKETALKELRLTNQYFAGGAGAEGEIARYLEKNKTLTKLGYNFSVPSFRTKVDGFMMRNNDYARKQRASITV